MIKNRRRKCFTHGAGGNLTTPLLYEKTTESSSLLGHCHVGGGGGGSSYEKYLCQGLTIESFHLLGPHLTSQIPYHWLVGNGGMGYNYNYITTILPFHTNQR